MLGAELGWDVKGSRCLVSLPHDTILTWTVNLDTPNPLTRRRQWHPSPVLLPGKSHGQRSLVGCSPWGHWGSDTTEQLHFHFSLSGIGEGKGNPLQRSCLENPRDGGAWWAAVYGVAQSQTRLKRLSSSNSSSSSNPLPRAVWFQTPYWADQNKSSEAKYSVAISASGGKGWGGQKGVQQRIREGALSLEFNSSNSSPGSALPDLPPLTWVISHDWASGFFAAKQMKFLPSRFIVRAEPSDRLTAW